jgi:DNA helicase-2/ATP-dependent DNA helicase PcrA
VHGPDLQNTVFSEKRIQVHIGEGIIVDGRIDLIRRLDTDEVAIVDFKSKETVQTESLTMDQLHVYALGYSELTGESADVVEILNLDEKGKNIRSNIAQDLLDATRLKVLNAGEQIKNNQMEKHKVWCGACASCDFVGLCRKREKT